MCALYSYRSLRGDSRSILTKDNKISQRHRRNSEVFYEGDCLPSCSRRKCKIKKNSQRNAFENMLWSLSFSSLHQKTLENIVDATKRVL